MAEELVTQITQEYSAGGLTLGNDSDSLAEYNSKIHLNIRGKPFQITRDELMSLPESILLSLFPNGVFLDFNGQVITNLTEDDVVFLNFDPTCFEYILRVFGDAQNEYLELSALSPQPSRPSRLDSAASVLQTKPAIIVLREDLDYYVIPPCADCTPVEMRHLKTEAGAHLLRNKAVFLGLGYNVDLPPTELQTLGVAEQHLFDMLCTSGFCMTETWGSRSMEPSTCVVQSLVLVRLLTMPVTPPESPSLYPVSSNTSRSRGRIASLASSAQRAASRSLSRARKLAKANQTKLLLFWRKPARKCWWSNQVLTIDTGLLGLSRLGDTVDIKIHVRRVWTLELSVIGVQ